MAGRRVALAAIDQRRFRHRTDFLCLPAAGPEPAFRRRKDGARHVTREQYSPPAFDRRVGCCVGGQVTALSPRMAQVAINPLTTTSPFVAVSIRIFRDLGSP